MTRPKKPLETLATVARAVVLQQVVGLLGRRIAAQEEALKRSDRILGLGHSKGSQHFGAVMELRATRRAIRRLMKGKR